MGNYNFETIGLSEIGDFKCETDIAVNFAVGSMAQYECLEKEKFK